ncbi:hypothetical protein [Ureaplasma canigenitalium]|uniref:hypothetical protein n=1 Tax=Ureaplasma canigenitalium TaxID=42092 RepID=UPI0004E266FA|nr:hypothetical protein [Ureaplasma canigenitalium]
MSSDKSMANFIDFLEKVVDSKQNGNTGDEFEHFILKKLDGGSFTKVSLKKEESIDYLNNLLKIDQSVFESLINKMNNQVLDKNNIQVIRNPFGHYIGDLNWYVYEPYGKQNFPDLLIFTSQFIFPIEIKFSTKRKSATLPKGNSNIPKENTIYLYANTEKHNPIIFLGSDYIGRGTRKFLNSYFDFFNEDLAVANLNEELKNDPSSYNPFGLYPKIRTDFICKNEFVFGNDEKLSIFDFAEKMEWRENVFQFLRDLAMHEEE